MNSKHQCRLCLIPNSCLLPIYEIILTDGDSPISAWTFMNSFLENPLPDSETEYHQICVGCLFQVKRFYEFKVKCDTALCRVRNGLPCINENINKINRPNQKLRELAEESESRIKSMPKNIATEYMPKEDLRQFIKNPPPDIQNLPVIPLSSLLKVAQFFKHSNMRSRSNLYKVVVGEKKVNKRNHLQMDEETNVQVITASPGETDQAADLCSKTPYNFEEHLDTAVKPLKRPFKDHDYPTSCPRVAYFRTQEPQDMSPNIYAADASGMVDRRVSWPSCVRENRRIVQRSNTMRAEPPELIYLPSASSQPLEKCAIEEKFECPAKDCEESSTDVILMINHIHNNHFQNRQCQICYAKDVRHATKHSRLHLRKTKFCQICGNGFPGFAFLKEHIGKALPNKLTCDICTKKFCLEQDYNAHMRKHEAEQQGTYKIKVCCTQEFYDDQDYSRHKLRQHYRTAEEKEKNYICKYCPEKFSTRKDLIDHEKQERSKQIEFKCPECPRTFTTKAGMVSHKKTHKENVSNATHKRCDLCFEVFTNLDAFRRHRRDHFFLETPCEKCGRVFSSKDLYKRHLYHAHTERRRFRCEVCNMSFKFNVNLKTHTLSRVHKEKVARLENGSGALQPNETGQK